MRRIEQDIRIDIRAIRPHYRTSVRVNRDPRKERGVVEWRENASPPLDPRSQVDGADRPIGKCQPHAKGRLNGDLCDALPCTRSQPRETHTAAHRTSGCYARRGYRSENVTRSAQYSMSASTITTGIASNGMMRYSLGRSFA